MKNEMLAQLQSILGENADVKSFKHFVNLLENNSFSVPYDMINLNRQGFETLILQLLTRLNIAIEQMNGFTDYDFAHQKFLNLMLDLLKIKMITPLDFKSTLTKAESSPVFKLFDNLKNEARELLVALAHCKVIGISPEKQIA